MEVGLVSLTLIKNVKTIYVVSWISDLSLLCLSTLMKIESFDFQKR